MANIHPTAIIENGATIGDNCTIGAYCHVGANVTLHDTVTLQSHVVVAGDTTIGAGTVVYPFASIGSQPQDLKFSGERSRLVIGQNNTIREHVTMNPGTQGDNLETVIGDNNLFMVGVHVAHDSRIGNHCIFANNSGTAGHVVVGDYVVMGFMAGAHQHVRIGCHAMIGAMSFVGQDVMPYTTVMADRSAELASVNLVGLKRRGFSKDSMNAIRHATALLSDTTQGDWENRIATVRDQYGTIAEVATLLDFITADSSRGITL